MSTKQDGDAIGLTVVGIRYGAGAALNGEWVRKSELDALAARLAEAEKLLMENRELAKWDGDRVMVESIDAYFSASASETVSEVER